MLKWNKIYLTIFFFFIKLFFPVTFYRGHLFISCCHHSDSVISILLYHHPVYHSIYSDALPCSKLSVVVILVLNKMRRILTLTNIYVHFMWICTHTLKYVHIRNSESSDSCSQLIALEFKNIISFKGIQARWTCYLFLKKNWNWEKVSSKYFSANRLHPLFLCVKDSCELWLLINSSFWCNLQNASKPPCPLEIGAVPRITLSAQ